MITVGEDGAVKYGTPVPMPGSVSLSLDANGEPENFYADGGVYYVINNNTGYEGDLELPMEDFLKTDGATLYKGAANKMIYFKFVLEDTASSLTNFIVTYKNP